MDSSPSVFAVILNWNGLDLTLPCLASVLAMGYPNLTAVVVDNGSTDGSVSSLRARFPEVVVLENGRNLGYAQGNNVGIRYALSREADYVLVLNNDTLVADGMLSELVRLMESRPEMGMAGPTVYCVNPPDTLFAAGSFVHWSVGEICHRGLFKPASRFAVGAPEPVDCIVGCGLLVRRGLIEAIGVFNPLYYLNFEDVEWGVRALRFGWQSWYVPQAVMWHKASASLGPGSPANTYYMTRNALLFFSRNGPLHLRPLAMVRIMARTLRTVAAWSVRRQYQSDVFRKKRDANVLALRDFFLGRFGKMGRDVEAACFGTS